MKKILYLIIPILLLTSCELSQKEKDEYFSTKIDTITDLSKLGDYHSNVTLDGINGLFYWNDEEYFIVSGHYGRYLVPLNNYKKLSNKMSDYIKIKNQHTQDSMLIESYKLQLNKQKQINEIFKQLNIIKNQQKQINEILKQLNK
jgi:hypothetical protein